VIVDVLVIDRVPGHDDRSAPEGKDLEDAAGSAVGHDPVGRAHEAIELSDADDADRRRPPRSSTKGGCLDDCRVSQPIVEERIDPVDEAIHWLRMGAQGDEDHRTGPMTLARG
jgi:hypothetical protein